jgi:hypothetical protein
VKHSVPILLAATIIAATPVSASAAGPGPTATATTGPTRTATLITGDRVALSGPATTIQPIGVHRSFRIFQLGADHYVVPAEATPYLGRQLDRSLFDATALAAAGSPDRVPVSLTFTAAPPTAPPGLTFTSTSGNTAQGYVTDGPAFAAALRAQIGADVASGHQPGSGALFGGLTEMRLAGTVAAQAQPHYPLHILRLTVTNLAGQPADGVPLFLVNTDSVHRQTDLLPVSGGLAKVAVPAGNYSLVAFFSDFDAKGTETATRTVTQADFAVTDDTATQTVDERAATSLVSVSTPRAADQDVLMLSVDRLDATGHGYGFTDVVFGGSDLAAYVAPQPAAAVGRLHYVLQWGGQPHPQATDPYRYDVAFSTEGIPADEAFRVSPSQVATVRQRLSADPVSSGTGSLLNGVIDDVQLVTGYNQISNADFQPVPQDLTEYLGTADGGRWAQLLGAPSGELNAGDVQTYAAGHDYVVEWNHGPLAPGLGHHVGPQQVCQACIAGDTLHLGVNELDDSDPTHAGVVWGAKDHLALALNGTTLVNQDNRTGATVTGLPSAPGTLQLVYDQDLTQQGGFGQSSASHTELTVKYQPGSDPTRVLPAYDTCDGGSTTTPCTVLPAMDVNLHLASDLTGTSVLPVQVLGLRVGHVSYDGFGARIPINSVTVSVSFDDGVDWQPATVSGSAGIYIAQWAVPASAADSMPWLRVTATDTAGNAIDQTVRNAYHVAKTAR